MSGRSVVFAACSVASLLGVVVVALPYDAPPRPNPARGSPGRDIAPARFGYNGLSDNRLEGDGTTPTGIYTLPLAFGLKPNPGTRLPWHHVDAGSWWDENSLKPRYNTWHENCASTICWKAITKSAHSSEHLADYAVQYAYAAFIGFNAGTSKVLAPARPSGSAIFLHVNGTGYTAGCVSIPQSSLVALLRWLNPAAKPHIAIGNSASITRF